MTQSNSNTASERWARRACGTLAVGGGASALVTTFANAEGLASTLAYVIALLFSLVYVAGVWIGLRLIENKPGAWKLLKIYMWVQVPVLQTGILTYFLGALFSVSCVYAGGVTFRFVFAPAGGWTFSLFTAQPAFGIGVNLVPVCALLAARVFEIRR